MKKISLGLLSFASLALMNDAFAGEVPQASADSHPPSSNFTAAQLSEIEQVVSTYLTKHPEIVVNALQEAEAEQQKEVVAKMEKAVLENKDKIYKNAAAPIAGNAQGTQTLVVFMDPYCGFCKKFHAELDTLLNTNKDVKVIFKDIPIMGSSSVVAIKAMLAAKEQGKYDQLQKAVFSSEKPLTKKQLVKIAGSLGIDTKKLEADMKNKATQAHIDQDLELAKALGINGTPTLIIGERKVVPGYVEAEELNKMLRDGSVSINDQAANEKKAS